MKNQQGLDEALFRDALVQVLHQLPSFSPDDLARELGRVSALCSDHEPPARLEPVDDMTRRKALSVIQFNGFSVSGLVLRNPAGRACVIEMGAVRWLSPDEIAALMHPTHASDDKKAADYFRACLLHHKPRFLPSVVRVLCEQSGDAPECGAGVAPGDYACLSSPYGAVSVTDRAGKRLGLRMDAFEPLAWRENTEA